MVSEITDDIAYNTFGKLVKTRRESLDKSIRGMAGELDMTPAYLSDIEKGNRYAPEKYLAKMIEVLKISNETDVHNFYDLAGKSRNENYPDLKEYIGKKHIARVALRRARDYDIPDSKWKEFIDNMNGN